MKASLEASTETFEGCTGGSVAPEALATSASETMIASAVRVIFIGSSMYERELRRFQLNARAARVEAGERDWQAARYVRLSEQGACGGALQGPHHAVCGEGRFHRREIVEQIRIAEADADDGLPACEQGLENARALFRNAGAVRSARTH